MANKALGIVVDQRMSIVEYGAERLAFLGITLIVPVACVLTISTSAAEIFATRSPVPHIRVDVARIREHRSVASLLIAYPISSP